MENKINRDLLVKTDDPALKAYLGASGHRARWLGLIYDEAQKAGQSEQLEEILWKATLRSGHIIADQLRKVLQDGPVDCDELKEAWFRNNKCDHEALQAKVITCTPERLELEYHGCALLDAWIKLGLDDKVCQKLCRIAMNQDTGIAESLGLKYDLYETLADGGECCRCAYYK